MSDRETHDLFFGYPEPFAPEPDETGSFATRVVYLDGVERITPEVASLREALIDADKHRSDLALIGYDRTRVHIDVIDLNDGERRLDWDTLETE